jgi:hypothetical protein
MRKLVLILLSPSAINRVVSIELSLQLQSISLDMFALLSRAAHFTLFMMHYSMLPPFENSLTTSTRIYYKIYNINKD